MGGVLSSMPDPDFYSQCLQDSFDEHIAAVKKLETVESAPPKKTKSKAAAKTPQKTKK